MINPQHLAIGVSLIMRDNFTAQAMRASASMNTLHGNAQKLAAANATLARNTNAIGAAIGVGLIGGMNAMNKEAADFNFMIKYINKLSDETGNSFDSLKKKAIEVGKSSTFSPDEVASGMRWMAQAGMKSESILNSVRYAANLAQATMTDLGGRGGGADWLTNIALAWEVPLENAEKVERLSNVLAKAANKSNTTLLEFGEGMKYTQATATRMNMSLEETAATLMVLANIGIQGSMSGTATENMLRYASRAAGAKSGSKQADALAYFGLSSQDMIDATGNLKDIGTLLDMFYSKIAQLDPIKAQNAIVDIFGVRGARATAVGKHINTFRGYVDELSKADNYAADVSKDMMNTSKGTILILQDTWKAFKISFGDAIDPLFTGIRKVLIGVLNVLTAITQNPLGKWLAMGVAGFIILKTVTMGYRAIVLTINLMKGQMATLMGTASATSVAGYTRMNTAASAYAATLNRINMMTGLGAAGAVGSVGRYKHGGYYQIGPGGGYIPLSKGSGKIRMAQASNFLGRWGGPMALGGMALSGMTNNDTAMGATGGVIGDGLMWAGTGAMLGSIIPGVGTLVGGVVGGTIGLIMGIKNNFKELDDKIKAENERLKGIVDSGEVFNSANWKRRFEIYEKLNFREDAYRDAQGRVTSIGRSTGRLGPDREYIPMENTIILHIDGRETMRKTYNEDFIREYLKTGI